MLNTILKNAHDQEGKATNTLEKKRTSQECYQHLENRILGQILYTGEKKRKEKGGVGGIVHWGNMVARGQKYYSLP